MYITRDYGGPHASPPLRSNHKSGYLARYFLLPGPKVATRAEADLRFGSYLRRSFDHPHLDKEIASALRRIAPGIGHALGAVVLLRGVVHRSRSGAPRHTASWDRGDGCPAGPRGPSTGAVGADELLANACDCGALTPATAAREVLKKRGLVLKKWGWCSGSARGA